MATASQHDITDAQLAYGTKVVGVEPGGVEVIPLDERHGHPMQLLWTWASPNMEFATVAVGILGVLAFGLTFWQAVLAILIGTALGSICQAVLSTWGPRDGLCQMVLSRTGFGFVGNVPMMPPRVMNSCTAILPILPPRFEYSVSELRTWRRLSGLSP